MNRILLVGIVPLALILWGSFGAPTLATESAHAFADYQTPYVDQLAPGNEDEPLTAQVVLIVAEGLRLDQAQQMSNVHTLRARGAERVMRAGLPSFALPGWSVIGTGAWQEQHGQTTDLDPKTLPLDSIFLAARRKGLTTALTGSPGWAVLFKDQIDTLATEPDPADAQHHLEAVRKHDDAVETDALSILTGKKPNLFVIHFMEAKEAAHGQGAFSAQAQQATQDLDNRLGRLLTALDLSATTVVFTSDHGQTDRGGEGGPEDPVLNVEFVAAGRGITPGQYGVAQQADIAPTLATLLGSSIPTDSQGDVLFDMLDAPPALKAQRTVDWARQSVARSDSIASVLAVGTMAHPKLAIAQNALASDDYAAAIAAAQAEVQATRDVLFAFREGRLETERLMRTPLFLLGLAPVALYAWLIQKKGWEFRRPLLGALAYFVVYYGLYFGRGYYFSLSIVNLDGGAADWFAARTVDALIALAVSAVVVGLFSASAPPYQTLVHTIHAAFLIAALLWLQVDAFYWLFDFRWPWFLPDQALGLKFYLDTLQTGAFTLSRPPLPTIVFLPPIALAARWLARRAPFGRATGAVREDA